MHFPDSGPFKSFWMGGYECADHLNKFGERVDLLAATSHLDHIVADYNLLRPFNIRTVREGIRWSQVEYAPYKYDWNAVALMMDAAAETGIQQVWDICHFGFPDDLSPLHPKFPLRFESLCREFVRFYRGRDGHSTLIITPINEVSFLSWLGGDACGTSPFCVRQGWEVKYHLMKAYIRGVAAMKEIDPGVQILPTEPLVNVVPSSYATEDERALARRINEEQFQALDILCGTICPELGGSPAYADIIGFNFYYNNQWMLGDRTELSWAPHDRHPHWEPLQRLLQATYRRYDKPMVITETSHPGVDRPLWLQHVAEECSDAIAQGIPLWGICLYPIIDRPDWDFPDTWHRSGLWDEGEKPGENAERILHQPYADSLLQAQKWMSEALQQAVLAER